MFAIISLLLLASIAPPASQDNATTKSRMISVERFYAVMNLDEDPTLEDYMNLIASSTNLELLAAVDSLGSESGAQWVQQDPSTTPSISLMRMRARKGDLQLGDSITKDPPSYSVSKEGSTDILVVFRKEGMSKRVLFRFGSEESHRIVDIFLEDEQSLFDIVTS